MDKNRKNEIEERFDKAFEISQNLLSDYEQSEPNWVPLVMLDLVKGALWNLQHYLEGPDIEITWRFPFVELHYFVNWDWERARFLKGEFTRADFENTAGLAKKLVNFVFAHEELILLRALTNEMAVTKWKGVFYYFPPATRTAELEKLPESSRGAVLAKLCEPFTIGHIKGDEEDHGENGLSISDPSVNFKTRPVDMEVTFHGELDHKSVDGHLVIEIHPLVVDQDAHHAYFPLMVGLVFTPAKNGEVVDPSNWPADIQKDFWEWLFESLDKEIEELTTGRPGQELEKLKEVAEFIRSLDTIMLDKLVRQVNRSLIAGSHKMVLIPADPRIADRIDCYIHAIAGWIATEFEAKGKLLELKLMGLPAEVSNQHVMNNVFRREGDIWKVAYQGEGTTQEDSKGLNYIVQLLRCPNKEFLALDLQERTQRSQIQSRSPNHSELSEDQWAEQGLSVSGLHKAVHIKSLTPKAQEEDQKHLKDTREQYKRRLEELQEELRMAERSSDNLA